MNKAVLLKPVLAGLLWASPHPACAVDVAALLRSAPPGDSIRFGRSGERRWAEYCPDNTCERIEVDAKATLADFERFLVGYLWRAGTYLRLQDCAGTTAWGPRCEGG